MPQICTYVRTYLDDGEDFKQLPNHETLQGRIALGGISSESEDVEGSCFVFVTEKVSQLYTRKWEELIWKWEQ